MTKRRFERVAVLMGGPSRERDVSLRSGAAVARGLRESGYGVTEVDVTGHDLDLPDVEAVFIALHGTFGEDGQVQEILERAAMPYTGSGVESSRNSMDKQRSKEILCAAGVPTPIYEVLHEGDMTKMPLPLVVKPVSEGSSIGVHRIFRNEEWDSAFADALKYDANVLVEKFIDGRELTCGIVDQRAFPVVEIVAPDGWYDYGAKYTKGATEYLLPAPLDENTAREAQRMAVKTFEALGCRGLGRVDFRLSGEGELFVLEMNTIPGFTETSLLPKAAACDGIGFPALCSMIMETARLGI